MKFTQVFERMGLLEKGEDNQSTATIHFDGEEQSRSVSESSDVAVASEFEQQPPDETPVQADQVLAGEIDESRSLTDIYADAKIPASPFSANKLLKLLEGLNTLPEEVRKKAIIAMDAAEEDWTIEDPLLDAQRRIQALENEKQRLEEQANNAESRAESELMGQDQYEEQATAQIRQQIRELEELLKRELKSIAEARESIKARAKAVRQVCQRQHSVLKIEINRLKLISELFAPRQTVSTDQTTNPSGTQNG